MNRRQSLASMGGLLVGLAVPALPALAHTPYAQWDVFRKSNLQLLTSHADLPGDDTGELWVEVLREKLPLSRAMVSRAHDMPRIAALLKTNQSNLAVLSYMHARLMFTGSAPFEDYAPLILEVLVDNGQHLLVARPDLPAHHGYLIAAALTNETRRLHLVNPGKGIFGMRVHGGAKAFFDGERLGMPAEQ